MIQATALRVEQVPKASRERLLPILDQSFTGLYRFHARSTLRKVRWVQASFHGDAPVGLVMLSMLRARSGYVYYVAVAPAQRKAGLGTRLLDSGLQILRGAGAREVFACAHADNTPMVRLLASRGFTMTSFRGLVRMNGLASAVRLIMRMVAAPGEKMFLLTL